MQLQKKERGHFEQCTSSKKQCNFDSGQNNSSAIYIASSESFEPKRFVQCWNNYEKKKKVQEQQRNHFHCYNQNMGFVNRVDQNVANYWYPNEKMVMVSVCLNGRYFYSGCVGIALY